MTTISKEEYLKRYLSGTHDKKKKKRRLKISQKCAIVDDDVDIRSLPSSNPERTIDDDLAQNEPTVAEFIDERPKHVIQLEKFRQDKRWKIINNESNESTNSHCDDIQPDSVCDRLPFPSQNSDQATRRQKRHDSDSEKITKRQKRHDSDSDQSPQRQKRHDSDSDQSPKRHKRHNSDSDQSPQRHKRHDSDSDQSPQRHKRHDSDSDKSQKRQKRHDSRQRQKDDEYDASFSARKQKQLASDQSPPRRKQHQSDSDQSPPRRKQHQSDSDQSPPRRKRPLSDSDQSPPRRKQHQSDSDQSPPRRKQHQSDSDQSPPRRKRPQSDSDQSPHRRKHRRDENKLKNEDKHKSSNVAKKSRGSKEEETSSNDDGRAKKTLSGAKAGLSSAKEMREEAVVLRHHEQAAFNKIDHELLGKDAKTVFRDKSTGKRRNLKEESEKEKEKEAEELKKAKKYETWGKGMKQIEQQQAQLMEALHEVQKPLARYSTDTDLDALMREREREGDPMLAYMQRKKTQKKDSKPELPRYKGREPPANRFNLWPGYRWDGVDRSNGFEQKLFAKISEKKFTKDMAYKWSVEDM